MVTANEIKSWLEANHCHDCQPCTVEIDGQAWPACRYKRTLAYTREMQCVQDGRHKAGETYVEQAIYCVGPLPASYVGPKRHKYPQAKACFPFEGVDWCVAAYMPLANLREENQQFHPFGISFILSPWNVPGEAIDKWEKNPYTRKPLSVRLP